MKKLMIFLLFFLLPLHYCQAHILRGYDTIHQGSVISSSSNIHNGTTLAHLYFQKIISPTFTLYTLLAYDKDFQTIYTPDSSMTIILDGQSFKFVPQFTCKKINTFPFNRSELGRGEIILSLAAINALESAQQATLLFEGAENDPITYDLPPAVLNEWKNIISLKN
jgi:hypothetical protein